MRFCYSCMHQIEDEGLEVCPECGEPLEITCDTSRFLKPGTVLQVKFVVGKVIGYGGFGNTYIGWNKFLNCKVAIKEYFPKQLSSRGEDSTTVTVSDTVSEQRFRTGLHKFLEEARSLASLKDIKSVVEIYSFFEENGTGYIVMEYLEGKDVKQILEEHGNTMDYEWSRRVILTVLHTLKQLHGHGILHRDIAPDNVFVTNEGIVKLIDFGAAKHAEETIDLHGEIILKVGYAPIEQYGRQAQQGTYTDIYEVAALFYRMLTGVKPQPANERVAQDMLKPLSDMGVQVPEQAELAIMVCLNIQPQYRLQSAQEFMEALDGSDFVPVYEPEWILPDTDKPETFFGKASAAIGQMKAWQKAILLLGVLAIIGAGAGTTVFVAGRNQAEGTALVRKGDIHLPSCEGESEADASASLEALGVKIEVTYLYQPDSKEDTVISMEPAAGSMVNKEDIISLTVESSEYVTMPDYKDIEQEKVASELKDKLGDKYSDNIFSYNYTSNDEEKGKCYSQTAVDKVQISDMEDFKIQVSWGSEESYQVQMPDLQGKTTAQAKKLLSDAGLKMKLKTGASTYDNNASAGEIIHQSIKSGQKMNNNAADKKNYSVPKEVVIVVSKGPKPTPTPKPTPKPAQKPAATARPTRKPAANEENPFANKSPNKKKNDTWVFD